DPYGFDRPQQVIAVLRAAGAADLAGAVKRREATYDEVGAYLATEPDLDPQERRTLTRFLLERSDARDLAALRGHWSDELVELMVERLLDEVAGDPGRSDSGRADSGWPDRPRGAARAAARGRDYADLAERGRWLEPFLTLALPALVNLAGQRPSTA